MAAAITARLAKTSILDPEPSRKPYDGNKRKLILAFDVGTTFSGASYCILDPGHVPKQCDVTRFPGQNIVAIGSKVPTIIYYDSQGVLVAIGAEAVREGIEEQVIDNGWSKAEWFKLHLRSARNSGGEINHALPPLPPNKSVVDLFADFLRFLNQCTIDYIVNSSAQGKTVVDSVKDDTYFILSHPNGWEGREQQQMRKAAVMAGLVPNTQAGHARLVFVSEGEASLHFAIENGMLHDAMSDSTGIMIVDAGGGTIDISTYQSKGKVSGGIDMEEIAAPHSYFNGSVSVSLAAKVYLRSFLQDSPFLPDLDHIVRCFDETTKLRFRSDKDNHYVKFGPTRDNDIAHNIRHGQLKLSGSDMALFFEESIQTILLAFDEQRNRSQYRIAHIALVGGFASSEWLFDSVKARLSDRSVKIFRAEHHSNKAVSQGAITFYLKRYVSTRTAKFTYGFSKNPTFDAKDPAHIARLHKKQMGTAGVEYIPRRFIPLLPKGTRVTETAEFRTHVKRNVGFHEERIHFSLFCYRGQRDEAPQWMDEDKDNFAPMCVIEVDVKTIPFTRKTKPNGEAYKAIYVDTILLFGGTEFTAQIAWKENGDEKRSPATLIYEPDAPSPRRSKHRPKPNNSMDNSGPIGP